MIITGARQKQQIDDCYNFINNVFRDNFSKVKKVLAPFYDEKKENKVVSKKYVKPNDIIYLDPSELQNEFNELVYKDYQEYVSSIV